MKIQNLIISLFTSCYLIACSSSSGDETHSSDESELENPFIAKYEVERLNKFYENFRQDFFKQEPIIAKLETNLDNYTSNYKSYKTSNISLADSQLAILCQELGLNSCSKENAEFEYFNRVINLMVFLEKNLEKYTKNIKLFKLENGEKKLLNDEQYIETILLDNYLLIFTVDIIINKLTYNLEFSKINNSKWKLIINDYIKNLKITDNYSEIFEAPFINGDKNNIHNKFSENFRNNIILNNNSGYNYTVPRVNSNYIEGFSCYILGGNYCNNNNRPGKFFIDINNSNLRPSICLRLKLVSSCSADQIRTTYVNNNTINFLNKFASNRDKWNYNNIFVNYLALENDYDWINVELKGHQNTILNVEGEVSINNKNIKLGFVRAKGLSNPWKLKMNNTIHELILDSN